MDFAEACEFVRQHHRHHVPPVGHKATLAVSDGDAIRGVAILGRPVARELDNGWTLEVTRVATDGVRNGCSKLYGAAWRLAQALGYRRLVTYTLASEGGGQSARRRLALLRGFARREELELQGPPARQPQPPSGPPAMGNRS